MTMAAQKKGKPENRKRKMSDSDQESEEEEEVITVAPVKAVTGSTTNVAVDDDRRDERDKRTLFLKHLPGNCTVRHIKALSKDIKQVRLRSTFSMVDNKRKRIAYAYVSFASEEAAEKNFKLLDGTVFKGTKIAVDYVGSKSQFKSENPKKEPATIDPLRLYVSGLPESTKEEDIKKLFPEATDIVLPKRNKDKLLFGYGFVSFDDADLAKKYHEESQDLVLNGRKLVVLYAKQRAGGSGKIEKKKLKRKSARAAVQQKVVVDDDEDDEDEDEDEDDDDDEDDDE